MNLRQLETFLAVADEASFSRAADRLHVVQSAVSSGIRALEQDLGATLFTRGARGAQLTDEGAALLPEARATLAAADAARAAVRDAAGGLRGVVQLGIMQAQRAPAPNVAEVLRTFKVSHPGVQVRVRHGGGSLQLAEQLRDGRLDLGFTSLPADPPPPGLDMILLSRQAIGLACHPDHPLAARPSVDLAAIGEETIADLPPQWGVRIATDQAFADARVVRSIDYEINDVATLLEFVRSGLAVTMVPASLIGDLPGIVAIPISEHQPHFEVSIATPTGRRLSAAARALRAHIIDGAGRGTAPK